MAVRLANVDISEAIAGDLLGFTSSGKPIVLIGGGAEDDSDKDEDDKDSDSEDEDEDDKDGKDEEYTPPTREEWDRVRRTMTKRKDEKKALERELAELRDKKNSDGDKELDEDTARKLREEGSKVRDDFWKPLYVTKSAITAAIAAGYSGNVSRLPKLLSRSLDFGEIEVDTDGELDGLEEQIRAFKKEFPEFFTRKAPGRVDGADKDGGDSGSKKTGKSPTSVALLKAARGR